MSRRSGAGFRRLGMIGALVLTLVTAPLYARDAAFMDPGASTIGAGDEAIKVDPKGDIDTGESVLNVARRTTLFFVNQTNLPVKVEKVSVNSDGNVVAEVSNDDCSKQGTIPALSRCSVEISVTPNSPGPWSVEALLTHDGTGRIARAKLTGKTSGSTAATERKDTGLALSTKDIAPVTFGDVDVGSGKAVRSALMINDSPDTITLYSIDVIEASNGLQRLDQGCAVDMELKPGESCPVTLVWTPTEHGQISTDLIIRHSGRLGFAVVPIRGNAVGGTATAKDAGSKSDSVISSAIPPPPGAQELERATSGKIAPVSVNSLGGSLSSSSGGPLRLIGTVGNRAVLLKPDGTTAVVDVNEEFNVDDKKAKITFISAKSVDILLDGKKKTLSLEAAPELTLKAKNSNRDSARDASSASSAAALFGASDATGGIGSTLSTSTK